VHHAWEVFFRHGVTDHAIKELCRLYISKSVECEYCGGQGSGFAGQLIELGHFIALTLGQQRFLKTVGVRHGEVLADTEAGLAPDEARRVRTAMIARTE
jgi:hypothetical protein